MGHLHGSQLSFSDVSGRLILELHFLLRAKEPV
jgi:hypothetical protein